MRAWALTLHGFASPNPGPEALGQVVDRLEALLPHGLQCPGAATARGAVQEIGHLSVETIQSRFETSLLKSTFRAPAMCPPANSPDVRTSSTTTSLPDFSSASPSATLTSMTPAEAVSPSSDGTGVSWFPTAVHPAARTSIQIEERMGTMSSRRVVVEDFLRSNVTGNLPRLQMTSGCKPDPKR